ncbi:MAG: DUF1440 domain-containing protein [Gemmatimonadota bacterium]
MYSNREMMESIVRGALAGLAATWAMGKVTTYLYEHEDEAAHERENRARGGKTAFVVAAEKGAKLLDVELSEEARPKAGAALHWAVGAGAGAVYGLLRERVPGARAGFGLGYGAAFFLVMDELGTAALGLTPGPLAFPWQTHARGLAGHLAFGASAELLLSVTDPIAH